MLNHLQNEFNKTQTTNGAVAYTSTKSDVLDLFALGGAFRERSDQEVVQLFSKAFAEDATLAMKTLFYLRDIREGQGERRFFRLALRHLATHNKKALVRNLHLIPEFGRWDDMWDLLETGVKDNVIAVVNVQLIKDLTSDGNPSLLGKWMPSANASSEKTKRHARMLLKGLGYKEREYRKMLTGLRNEIDIIETKLSEKNYKEIDYSKIPSRAGLNYRSAFYRNDEERYTSFLDSLSKGEVKVNSKVLYPYEIVEKSIESRYSWGAKTSAQDVQLLDGMWNNLPDFIDGRTENSIAVVDVSGSMSGTPMNVAVSLGIYLAERNKGVYHNHFLTFSEKPQLVKVTGTNIVEKVNNMVRAEWQMTTNIEAVFERLLTTAVNNDVPVEEMISKVYIISDMQFNRCARDADKHIFKEMSKRYEQYGYSLPSLVFWNVNASNTNTPFTKDENGVMLVSGFSPSIFKNLLGKDDINPYDLMLDVIMSERYEGVMA